MPNNHKFETVTLSKNKYILHFFIWVFLCCTPLIYYGYINNYKHQLQIVNDIIKSLFFILPLFTFYFSFKVKDRLYFFKAFLTAMFFIAHSIAMIFFVIDIAEKNYSLSKTYTDPDNILIKKVSLPNTTVIVSEHSWGGATGSIDILVKKIRFLKFGFLKTIKADTVKKCRKADVKKINEKSVLIEACNKKILLHDTNSN